MMKVDDDDVACSNDDFNWSFLTIFILNHKLIQAGQNIKEGDSLQHIA